MKKNASVAAITTSLPFVNELEKLACGKYTIVPKWIEPANDLSEIIADILGMSSGSMEIELAVIDADCLSSEPLFSLIDSLLAAGIPSFVSIGGKIETHSVWSIALLGALPLRPDHLREDFEKALLSRKFDFETLELENEFASLYDVEELSSPATLSAILWENEYVLKQIRVYAAAVQRPLRILDLGCGTGRFEEILFLDPLLNASIEKIDAIDFSPMYLKKAKERLSHFLSESDWKRVSLQRRIVEDTRLASNSYDLIIASFGVICFSQFHRTIPEIHRLLKPSGLAFFNGYNRNSLSYDFNEAAQSKETGSLFTALIDRKKNEMQLNGKTMKCFTFHIDELEAFLSFIGFKPLSETTRTFPTLYGCTRMDYLKQLLDSSIENLNIHEPHSCGGQGACERHASYQSKNLEKDFFRSGFSPILHKMDSDLTHVLKDRGFYFSMIATK